MSKIAVDIVLLPDETVSAQAVAVNRDLVERYGRHIVLDGEHLPHISLAMGCIETEDIEPARRDLEVVARECPPGDLVITGIATILNAAARQISSFLLAQTEALHALHERVMTEMQAYFTYDVAAQMVYGDQEVAETTLGWICTYPEKAAFRAFYPHITLGYGSVSSPMIFPIPCKASRLALCHLGNHCTCRKVLVSIDY
ncbi:MAG: 2'-5' RNA ligase family protein [Sedimentisphaerales bacterium]|nr:2'-5' RNA ligase family protein [Sedimentisphaerales bacterium]